MVEFKDTKQDTEATLEIDNQENPLESNSFSGKRYKQLSSGPDLFSSKTYGNTRFFLRNTDVILSLEYGVGAYQQQYVPPFIKDSKNKTDDPDNFKPKDIPQANKPERVMDKQGRSVAYNSRTNSYVLVP